MVKNDAGEKVSPKVKAKLELKKYLEAYNLEQHCSDFDDLRRTEPTRVQGFIDKLREGLYKKLVVK